MKHLPPAHLLTKPIRVHVIGCGGTGSAVASGLPYLHHALLAKGHPFGLDVTLVDGDTISEANCVRQPFSAGEVGHPKATILASRMNLFWGVQWKASARYQEEGDTLATDIVIGCVDSRRARAIIASCIDSSDVVEARSYRVSTSCAYWLDIGNNAADGQYVLGQPAGGPGVDEDRRLLLATELYPELLDVKRDNLNMPSCSAAEAITRQAPFVNQVLANHALSLLAQLFGGGIRHQGAFVNLTTGRAAPIMIPEPAEVPAEVGS